MHTSIDLHLCIVEVCCYVITTFDGTNNFLLYFYLKISWTLTLKNFRLKILDAELVQKYQCPKIVLVEKL